MHTMSRKSLLMAPYGGIIRIRLKGRGSQPPLSLFTSSPVFLYYNTVTALCQCFDKVNTVFERKTVII